jgi:thiol-disulfide isomerase/thioredoxin
MKTFFHAIIFSLSLLLALPATARVADRKPGHKIEVKIKGFTASEMMLAYHLGNKQYLADTVQAENGKAVFEGEERLEGGIYLVVLPPKNQYFEIVIADDQHFSLQTDTTDLVQNMTVSGSEENRLFYENLQKINLTGRNLAEKEQSLKQLEEGSQAYKDLQEEINQLYSEMSNIRNSLAEEHPELFYSKVIRAMQEPDFSALPEDADQQTRYRFYRHNYLKNIDWSDKRLLRTPILYRKITQYMDRLTVQHFDSIAEAATKLIDMASANDTVYQYVAVTLLNKYANSKVMCQDAAYVAIVDHVYVKGNPWWAEEEQVKKIKERANALRWTLCGRTAPEMRMESANGNIESMMEQEGQFTILYFWDIDCGHCKKVTPKLAELYPKYQDKGVVLYTVSINGTVEKWKEKLSEYGLDKTQAINAQDHERTTHFDYYYDIRSTPRIILLDQQKKILAKQISVEQLEEILDRQLEEEAPEKELDSAVKENKGKE